MKPVRWFYCRQVAWRVVRRPDKDGGTLEAWAVFKGGNTLPRIVHVERAASDDVVQRMKAALTTVVRLE